MTLLAPALQRYFTDYAHAQRDLSFLFNLRVRAVP